MILKLIRLINNETENFNEKYHEKIREKFHCESLKCPNCGSRELISYGTYTRNILVHGEIQFVDVHRVFCNNCHHTHAVLTLDFIPYCFIDQATAYDYFCNKTLNIEIDFLREAILTSLLKRIKKLKAHYLNCFKDVFDSNDLAEINEELVEKEKHSFLQTHRGSVYLNITPT